MRIRFTAGTALALLGSVLHAGPVAHYTFDETSGTTAVDSGSAGVNGLIGSNVTLGTPGKFGTAFTFNNDASDAGIVDMGNAAAVFNAITASQKLTISVWLKWTTSGTRDCAVFLGDNAATNRYVDLGSTATTGGVYSRTRNGANSTYPDLLPSGALDDGQWHHLAYTVDAAGEVTRLYVDGVLAGSTTTTPAVTLPSVFNNFEVGRLGRSGPTDAFAGSIDELRIYDSALTAAEIQQLAQGPAGDPYLQITPLESTHNGQPSTLTVPFSNAGTSHPLALTGPAPVTIGGADAAYFSVSSYDNNLAPGASGAVRLNFDPTLPGGGARSYSSTLTIASNDSAQSQKTIALQLDLLFGSADSDMDGLPDDWEVFHDLDPADDGSADPANGANGDPDNDGLPNSEEHFLDSDPRVNQSGRAWLPRPAKAAVMIVSAHPDDEGIFFGGALPYYAGTKDLPTLLVSMTSGDWTLGPPVREAEMREAAWAYRLRYQPLFPRFRDVSNSVQSPYPDKIDATWDYWADGILQNDGTDVEAGKSKAIRYLATQFRKYRPEVVATHDLSGEYGHYNHMATAWAVTRAFETAADPLADAQLLDGLSPWQIKKLYLHKLPSQRLFHDHWETPSIDDGGTLRSPREVANLGLDFHVTQSRPNVSTVYAAGEVSGSWAPHPSEWWGLHASTVGPDSVTPDFTAPDANSNPITYSGWARGDFLKNLTIFPDHDDDGLPDAWERTHFGTLAAADPLADNDGDGRNNRDEFISGLDPALPDRTALSISAESGIVSFTVPAATGPGYEGLRRRHRLRFSPDLSDWDAIVAEGISDGTPLTHDIDPGTRGFYRLEITIE